ncbi:MAG: TIGR00645 family protein, partial [Cyanobacteria bacterium SZAS LIN-2]|nr:TIGR00645 family protein [Cyanobacteria bacterium SZAS LIN-2]
MNSQIEKIIFGGRLMLLPMYLGLILTLLVYAIRFSVQTAELLWHSLTLTDTQIL